MTDHLCPKCGAYWPCGCVSGIAMDTSPDAEHHIASREAMNMGPGGYPQPDVNVGRLDKFVNLGNDTT